MRKKIFSILIVVLFLSITNVITAQNNPDVGKPAPEITLASVVKGPNLQDVSLSKLKGKVIIVEFWATWCGPCNAAIPHLNELAKFYKDKPVVFISISDEKKETIAEFLKIRKMDSWVVSDNERKTKQAYGVEAVPATFIIDKEGNLVWRGHPDNLTEKLITGILSGEKSDTKKEEKQAVPGKTELVKPKLSFRPGMDPLYSGFSETIITDKVDITEYVPYETTFRRTAYPESSSRVFGAYGTPETTMGITMINEPISEMVTVIYKLITNKRLVIETDLPKERYDFIWNRGIGLSNSLQEGWDELKNLLQKVFSLKFIFIDQEKDVIVFFPNNKSKLLVMADVKEGHPSRATAYTLDGSLVSLWEGGKGQIAVAENSKGLGIDLYDLSDEIYKDNELTLKWLDEHGVGHKYEKRIITMLKVSK